MQHYIGLIHKDPASDYGVSFPDFPGCVTAGQSLDEARFMAEEALALHVEGLVEDGDAIPKPSSLETIMSDPDHLSGVAILVPLKMEPRRAVRVNVTFPEDLLREIDRYAEGHGLTRSGFLARAAKQAIDVAAS